ncbi:MAG: HEAT repeat domain-containing protein, partial [Elusimicrobiota bacterium]
AALQEKYSDNIRQWLLQEALKGRNKAAVQKASSLKKEIEADFQKSGAFAFSTLQKVNADSSGSSLFLVFDAVETADSEKRLPYRVAPSGRLPDPAGMLADWVRYQETGWELVHKGELPIDRVPCPAFYCTWGGATPTLKALEDRFIAEVPVHKDALARILNEDGDPARRAQALYLLSYLKEGQELAAAILPGIVDPDERVREAALRVFGDIAVYHRETPLPVAKIAEVLAFPLVDDRTRGLAVLVGLADHPVYRGYILQHAAQQVLKLLRLKNPSNHDMAYTVLQMLSGERFPPRDYEAWEAWLQKARQADRSGAPDK